MGGGVRIAGEGDGAPAVIPVAFEKEGGRAGAAQHREQAGSIYLKQLSRTGGASGKIFFQIANPGFPGLASEEVIVKIALEYAGVTDDVELGHGKAGGEFVGVLGEQAIKDGIVVKMLNQPV